jgi:xanthine dehydrogenase YagS FAD-binding subunit
MKSFKHFTVNSVDEAVLLLKTYEGRSKIIAGGTDLLGVLKSNILPDYPEAVVNIKNIKGLDKIESGADGFLRIGPLVRLKDIIRLPLIKGKCPVLATAAETVATNEIRNMATIGGNICQDIRCWYYRYPHAIGGRFICLRKEKKGHCPAVKGDNRYHAIMGGKGCFAVCPSDIAVALSVMDGVITLSGPEGNREINIQDFYTPLGTVMKSDEIVTEIRALLPPQGTRQSFHKFTLRKPIDFAVVSVASLISMKGSTCQDAKIALGGVSHTPVRAQEAEQTMRGKDLEEALAAAAAEAALKGARPLGKNAYKIEIAKTLIKKSLLL